jgi:hypothetical protein
VILDGKPGRKTSIGRPKPRWGYSNETAPKEI